MFSLCHAYVPPVLVPRARGALGWEMIDRQRRDRTKDADDPGVGFGVSGSLRQMSE